MYSLFYNDLVFMLVFILYVDMFIEWCKILYFYSAVENIPPYLKYADVYFTINFIDI